MRGPLRKNSTTLIVCEVVAAAAGEGTSRIACGVAGASEQDGGLWERYWPVLAKPFSFLLALRYLKFLKKQLPATRRAFRIREAADPGPLEAKQFHTCMYVRQQGILWLDETVKIGRYSSEFDKIQADLSGDVVRIELKRIWTQVT